uniref:ran-binding protein 9-like n=2 Tax=Myxine glutinosa TaxID=7769 RepID=UPI00358FCA50
MAAPVAAGPGEPAMSFQDREMSERLRRLYPAVNEDETSLPRSWSPKDKFSYIGLSQNNLRVHYKGHGKTPKDAASVRATHPIPAACGIYYFEVKIVSKGRDGYMGIGLSAQGVNMNRLPGWDKFSYGYHGDDGHSFCSSGSGQPYGPTFTTGDVVGCCVNLINNTCFYTKNGHSLGVAFTDLPPNLYPTVGLQTPGEVVEANFGQRPFVFDIEDYTREWRARIQNAISRFPLTEPHGQWQMTLQTMVASYLVHHGYCATAEAFARATGQTFQEDLASIKNRQRIQKLVLSGRMGEAIETTQQCYSGLLERNPELLFRLKVRQFVEMVNGTDSEVRSLGAGGRSPKSQDSYAGSPRACRTPNASPCHPGLSHSAVTANGSCTHTTGAETVSCTNGVTDGKGHVGSRKVKQQPQLQQQRNGGPTTALSEADDEPDEDEAMECYGNGVLDSSETNGVLNGRCKRNTCSGAVDDDEEDEDEEEDEEEEDDDEEEEEDDDDDEEEDTEMDVDLAGSRRQLCGGFLAAVERMIQFGRELQLLCDQLQRESTKHVGTNARALQDAFSLLAYADPWSSPMGYQLEPAQREQICAALNSTILESQNLPKQPMLVLAMGQISECLRLMSRMGIGSCAFARLEEYLH